MSESFTMRTRSLYLARADPRGRNLLTTRKRFRLNGSSGPHRPPPISAGPPGAGGGRWEPSSFKTAGARDPPYTGFS